MRATGCPCGAVPGVRWNVFRHRSVHGTRCLPPGVRADSGSARRAGRASVGRACSHSARGCEPLVAGRAAAARVARGRRAARGAWRTEAGVRRASASRPEDLDMPLEPGHARQVFLQRAMLEVFGRGPPRGGPGGPRGVLVQDDPQRAYYRMAFHFDDAGGGEPVFAQVAQALQWLHARSGLPPWVSGGCKMRIFSARMCMS